MRRFATLFLVLAAAGLNACSSASAKPAPPLDTFCATIKEVRSAPAIMSRGVYVVLSGFYFSDHLPATLVTFGTPQLKAGTSYVFRVDTVDTYMMSEYSLLKVADTVASCSPANLKKLEARRAAIDSILKK